MVHEVMVIFLTDRKKYFFLSGPITKKTFLYARPKAVTGGGARGQPPPLAGYPP